MIELFKLNHSIHFPAPELALDDPNGLLAYGGDLSKERLIAAYQQGIFPWFGEDEPILWWSPTPRAIIYANKFTGNKSLKKSIRKYGYKAKLNTQFNEIIKLCAKVPRGQTLDNEEQATWINSDMINAYQNLHELGYAHSVEIYDRENTLVGGLYGVVVGSIFCGESMFHTQTDASKAALLALATHMRAHNLNIIDCQVENSHLLSLGCELIDRRSFLTMLAEQNLYVDCWQQQDLQLPV